ncbi:MAG: carboxypeptidase regulatory-like domain-containing protein [Holophagales bacterium]|nr:carboxypeptidase regulatory-like domain-containing protein [Holophagales bacterium]
MTRTRLAVALLAFVFVLPGPSASAGTLSGTVAIDGKPAAAIVSAIPFEEPLEKARRQARGEAEPKALASVTAGSGGAFALTVPAAPGKEVLYRVRIAAKGAIAAELEGIYDASETDELGELPLRKAEALAGRVTGPGGRPVAGARVTLTARGRFDGSFGLSPVPEESSTGADGTFRFENAASERNELLVVADGFAPAHLSGAKGGAQSRAIALVAGAPLSGSVKKRDGKPAAGALVRYEGDGLETRWVEVGADGTFRLADLPSRRGSVVADAGDDGFAEAPGVTPVPGGKPVVLALAPPTVLEGRTLDVATLKPVPRVKLTVSSGPGRLVARSGADGRYRLKGLRPADVTVRADEPAHVRWTRANVRLEKGATKVLDVPLTRGASLSGRVVDEDGGPVADARVRRLRRRQPVPPGDAGLGGRHGSEDPLARRRNLLRLASPTGREPADRRAAPGLREGKARGNLARGRRNAHGSNRHPAARPRSDGDGEGPRGQSDRRRRGGALAVARRPLLQRRTNDADELRRRLGDRPRRRAVPTGASS